MDLLFLGYFEMAKGSEGREERIVQFAKTKSSQLWRLIDLVILFLNTNK